MSEDVQSTQKEYTTQGAQVQKLSASGSSEKPLEEEPTNDDQKSSRLKSFVWNHFSRVTIDNKKVAICNGCNKKYAGEGKSGTTHLKNHLNSCLQSKKKVDVRQQLIQASFKKDPNMPYVPGKFKFSQEVSRMELGNMIVLHEYPLSSVDHIGFRRYSASLNPEFKVVSRNTIKADILKSFNDEKSFLKKRLSSIEGRVAITTDMWSAKNQKKGYMAVTGHFIDDDWKLQHHILRFIYVPAPHTSEALARVLINALVDFNLDEKVSTITLDNCTTNDGIITDLRGKLNPSKLILRGDILQMRCCAHILNLVVQDGLSVIGKAIEKVRDLVVYWVATPKRYEKFEAAVRYCKIPETKRLILDSKTRWNSTYEMLEIALLYKDAFYRLRQSLKKENFDLPDESEWERAREVCDKLGIFSKVTICFSGQNYPTANLYFQKVCQIRLALINWQASESTLIKNMADEMSEKFVKYWGVINGTLAVAALLDPRKKMEHITFYFKKLYGAHASTECDRVKALLGDLVDDYEKRGSLKISEENTLSSNVSNVSQVTSDLDDMEWERHVSTMPRKKRLRSEVDVYLDDDVMTADPEKFDILVYWSVVAKQYPILSMIARDILAIPITSVASESAFSASGRIISPSRSRLLPQTVEALMCLKSWRLSQFQGTCKDNALGCSSILVDEDVQGGRINEEDGDVESDDDDI